jgi:hypothetical protein
LPQAHDHELREGGLGRLPAIDHQPNPRHRQADEIGDVSERGRCRGQGDQGDGSGGEPPPPRRSARAERQNECLRRNSTA